MESYSKLLSSYQKLRKRTYSLSEALLFEQEEQQYKANTIWNKAYQGIQSVEQLPQQVQNSPGIGALIQTMTQQGVDATSKVPPGTILFDPQAQAAYMLNPVTNQVETLQGAADISMVQNDLKARQNRAMGGDVEGEDEGGLELGGEDEMMMPSEEEIRGEEINQEVESLSKVDMDRLVAVGAKHGLGFSEDDIAKQEDLNEKTNKNILAGYGTLRATLKLVFDEFAEFNVDEDPEPVDAVKEMNTDFNHLVDILDGIEDDGCVDFDALSDGQRQAVERFTVKQNAVWYGGNHESGVKPALLKQVAEDNTHQLGAKGGKVEGETLRHMKQYGVKLYGEGNSYQKSEMAANEVQAGKGIAPQGRIVKKMAELVRCGSEKLPLIRGASSSKTSGLSRARGEVDEILMQATPLLMKVLSLPVEAGEMRAKVTQALAAPVQEAIKQMSASLAKWKTMVDICWEGEDSDAMIVGEEADGIREYVDHLPWGEWGAGNFEKMAKITVLQFLKDNIQAMQAICAPISQIDVAGVVHTTADGTKISAMSGSRKAGKSILGAAGHSDTAEVEKADTLLQLKTPEAALEVLRNFGGATEGVRARQAALMGLLGVSQKVYGPEVNSDEKFDAHETALGKSAQNVRTTEEGKQIADLNKQALKERAQSRGQTFDEKAWDEAAAWDRESIESVDFALDHPGPALGPDSPDYTAEPGKTRGSLGNLIADLREEFKNCDNEDDLARELNLIIDGGYRGATKKSHPGLAELQNMDSGSKEYAAAKADMMSRIPMLRAAMKAREIPGNSAHNRKAKRFRGAYFAYQMACGCATSEQVVQIRVFGGRTYTSTQSALVDDLALRAMSGENVSVGPRKMSVLDDDGYKLGSIDSRVIKGAAKAHLMVGGRHVRKTAENEGIIQEKKGDKLMFMFSALLKEMGLIQS